MFSYSRIILLIALISLTMIGCRLDDVLKPPILPPEESVEQVHPHDHEHTPRLEFQQGKIRLRAFLVVPDYDGVDVYRKEKNEINSLIHKSQRFFADEMERHGYDRKTFRILYDGNGKVQVDIVKDDLYDFLNSDKRNDDRFPQHINIFFMLESREPYCGSGGYQIGFSYADLYHNCWQIETLNHEIGHSLGLAHNFRDGSYVMSYGVNPSRKVASELSEDEADQLDRHPAFNDYLFNNVDWDYLSKFMNYNSSDLIVRPHDFTFKFRIDYDPVYHNLLIKYDSATFQEVTEDWMIIEEFNHFTEQVKYKIIGDEIEYALTFNLSVDPDIKAASIRLKGPNVPIVQVGHSGIPLQ